MKAPADNLSPTHTAKPPTCPRVHTHLRTHDLPTTRALVAFLHATAGYPVKSTWLQAIKHGFYNSRPGLTYQLVANYCPSADATIQGHMAQPRQHIRSTTSAAYHQQTSLASPQHNIDIFTIPLNKIFTDDTGRFHPRARSGNQYIMIAFHADTNAILVCPFPNKHDVHHFAACQDIHACAMPTASKWQYTNCGISAITTPLPRPTLTTPPRVQALPPRVQPESPVRDTTLDPAPTTTWRTVPEHTQRGHHTTVDQPITACTSARLLATDPSCNSFAALAETTDEESDGTAMPMLDQDTGQFLEHKQLHRHPKHKATWDALYSNELGRLCQGIGHHPQYKHKKRIEGTNTFKPIQYQDIPTQRKGDVTYTCVVCEIRPQKAVPYRTRITLGSDRIRYPGDCGTKTSSLETVKLLLNSALSTPTALFASFNISNFYLGTPLDRPEYARIKLSDIPDDFVQEYSLHNFAHNGCVYFKVTKGVYGLKQAGKLANDLLTQCLEMHRYYQCATTPGLWRHKW
eukprot:CCRYP_007945-RA/>CCRYP_007945-RA protein AED:0.35 eAED:0.35 QI:0/0/0/1/1/1/2/0/516